MPWVIRSIEYLLEELCPEQSSAWVVPLDQDVVRLENMNTLNSAKKRHQSLNENETDSLEKQTSKAYFVGMPSNSFKVITYSGQKL